VQVSIIIPTFNSEDYLERAFASAVEQEGVSFEIIIVDNNSTDGTVALAERLRLQYPEIVRVAHEPKQGSAAARNLGVRLAKGEWIQFLDSDDLLLPGKIQRQIALVDDSVDWVLGVITIVHLNGEEQDVGVNEDAWAGLLNYTGLGHLNSNLYRRAILIQAGGFNESYRYCDDFAMYFILLKYGASLKKDSTPSALHIHHEGDRITTVNKSAMAKERVLLTNRVVEYLEKEKYEYYVKNEASVNSARLNCLRKQATYDIESASKNFRYLFPNGFRREDFLMAALPRFAFLFQVMGFENTERVRNIFAEFLPPSWKAQLK